MKALLSLDARILLARLLLIILAFGSLYGVYDNYEFLLRFPFYVTATLDLVFALAFLYFFIQFRKLSFKMRGFVKQSVLLYGGYVVIANVASLWLYTKNLGVGNLATEAGLDVPMYIAQQVLYLGVAPAIAFLVIWSLLRGVR